MKQTIYQFLLLISIVFFGKSSFGQLSSNTVNYKVSYDPTTSKYTVWVIPNYSTPNANNAGATEKGATAQVSLKVPNGFVISNITDVAGIWDKAPMKLGPNQQSQLAGQGLDATKAYYVIGKGASETDYGQFVSGTPVALFTFTGNGCLGVVEIIATTDPFVSVADAQLSLNTAPSFYSRSGQPAGGNQNPLEQYVAPAAGPANCFDAVNDTYTATAGTPTTQSVLPNDGFNGGIPTTTDVNVTVPTQPTNGTATVNPDGTITYTPNPGFTGTDTYTYQICDKANPTVCDVATVTVTVSCPVLAAPTAAMASPSSICSGSSSTLSATCASGAVTWYSDAALTTVLTSTTVSPATTTMYYASCVNGSCKSPSANVTVNVTATPSTPTAAMASPSSICSGSSSTLSATCASGAVTWYSDAALTTVLTSTTVSPAATTTYYASCVNGTCKSPSANVTVNVTATPSIPTAASASPSSICSGSSSTLSATCASGTVTWYSDAALTTALTSTTISPAATTTYYASCVNGTCKSPAANVTVNVTATPSTPTAASASPSSICSGSSSTLSATCASGAVTWYSDAALTTALTSTTVSPAATTTYYASCVNGTCKSPAANVTVNVTATPSTPTAASASPSAICSGSSSTLSATCASGAVTWYSDAALTTALTSTTVSPAATTTYYASCVNGTCKSPSTNVTVNVTATPSTPTAASPVTYCEGTTASPLTATAPSGTTLLWYTVATGGTGTATAITPSTSTVGTTSYYVASVSGGCESTTRTKIDVIVNIAPVNPTATTPVTYCQNAVASPLTATAPSGTTLRWYTTATGGTGSLTAPTPSTTAVGTTSYYVSAVSTLTSCESLSRTKIDVVVSNCKVIYAYNDNNLTPVNTPVSGTVLTNDNLNNGTAPLVVATTPVSQPLNGTVSLNANGTYTYIPAPNFVGNDSFKYRVCDSGSPIACDTATVFIDVYGTVSPTTNNPPVAIDDVNSTTKNTPVSGTVISNDKDPDAGQTLTATKLTNPTHGTVTLNPDGTYTYTPTTGYVGDDSFTYQVCDNGTPQLCDVATVQIVVKDTPPVGTNLPPVAGDDLGTTPSGSPVTGNLLTNDKDPEGGILTVTTTPVVNPTHGTVTINPDGTFTYTPTPGYIGSDSFVYEVCDNGTPKACTQATVYLQVTPGKVSLLPKAYLQGALFGVTGSNWMRDDLRVKNLLPSTSPYPAMGLTALTATGTVASSVFTVTGADAIVDWVFVELRDASNNQQVLDSRSALIQRDGDIVDIDGTSALTFTSAQPGSYYVVVKHRNHLGVMSKTPIALSAATTTVDFRQASTPTFTLSTGIIDQAQVVVEQGVALWAGNALYDNKVIYQGTVNDVNPIYQLVINASGNVFVTPYYKLKTYNNGDINMNGETIFQGTGNDIEFIYQNIIKNHPGNVLKQNFFVIKEQLP